MSDRLKNTTDLAALLDGELRDTGRIEALNAALARDGVLKAEYEEQRQIKGLLAGLEAHESPDYLSTRVMGEIALRGNQRTVSRLKVWLSAATGFAACLLLVLVVNQFGRPQPTMMAEDAVRESRPIVGPLASDGMGRGGFNPMMLPVLDENPELADFLQFASEAHHYNKLEHQLNQMTPDMPAAIQLLQGGQVYTFVLDESLSHHAAGQADTREDEMSSDDTNPMGGGQ